MYRKSMSCGPMVATLVLVLCVGCGGGGGEQPSGGPAPAATPSPKAAAPAPSGPPAPTGTAGIRGTIRYEGEVPKMKPLSMSADPACADKHTEPVPSEVLVLGDGNTMANVFVRVIGGLPEGSYPTPTEPVVLDQHGCRYVPHVVGVMVDQPFRILNSDGLLHNVHTLPKINSEFNKAMPGSLTETTETFTKVEDMFEIKCDVHPWMRAYVAVVGHPYFDVTGTDGTFEISGLPAGSYEVEVWHERLKTQTATVSVGDGETATQDFVYTR